jgi:hypothetical protein
VRRRVRVARLHQHSFWSTTEACSGIGVAVLPARLPSAGGRMKSCDGINRAPRRAPVKVARVSSSLA